jgi:putative ABC transport system permease protein
MSYALTTIWYERNRFLPAIFAVAFSAILIAVQGGLTIGLLSMTSVPVDKSTADLWVGYPGVQSVDLGRPIPEWWRDRLESHPEVERVESYVISFAPWTRIESSSTPATPENCTVIGTKLDPHSLGAVEFVRNDRELLTALQEPMTCAVDEAELGRLGIPGPGVAVEILGHKVRVVGLVHGYRSLGGPYVFCSLQTARTIIPNRPSEVTYLLAKCRSPEGAQAVKAKLARYPQMSAFTQDEFSLRSRLFWLTTTKAGIAVGFTALLGLLVGSVVTSQTLYAATAASQREYATMRAMGIPRWRLKMAVLGQSFWVGLLGVLFAVPMTLMLAEGANRLGTQVRLHPFVIATAAGITMLMAIGSGLAALRSFQGVDPAHNIR